VVIFNAQDILVGGIVFGAVGATLFSGLQKEAVMCDLCQGNGGARCRPQAVLFGLFI
jgi:hypothetical protein